MRKRGLSILLCLVMLVGLMPTTAFADGNIISSANITITKPVGGETPDFNPVSSEPEKYYAEVDDWGWMYAQSVTPMGPESKFKALNRYVLRILFRPKHGYFFANDCVFTINGEKTGCYSPTGNEFRQQYLYATDPQNPTYTVSFDADGGSGTMAEVTNVFADYKLPACTFIAPAGKYFSGWFVGGYMKDPGESILVLKDTKVLASWRNIPSPGSGFSVTYDGGDECGGSMAAQNKTDFYGELTLPECGFTAPLGKKFACWQVGNNSWNPGDKIIINFNTTVNAIWKDIPITHTVTFDPNGGTPKPNFGTTVHGVSGEYALPPNGITAPGGKEFDCWEVNGVRKNPGETITVTADVTVKALWKDIAATTYTISFDSNGGTGSMAAVANAPSTYSLPANGFTPPSGKQFKAWAVSSLTGEWYPNETISVNSNITLKAIWESLTSVKKEIFNVVATSSGIDSIALLYKQIKVPTFTVTEGAPAVVLNGQSNVDWQKMVSGVWEDQANGYFTPGEWRVKVKVYIGEPDSLAYKLGTPTSLTVDGESWAMGNNGVPTNSGGSSSSSHSSLIFAYSPIITIADDPNLQPPVKINEVNLMLNGYTLGAKIADAEITSDNSNISFAPISFIGMKDTDQDGKPDTPAEIGEVFEAEMLYAVAVNFRANDGYDISTLTKDTVKMNNATTVIAQYVPGENGFTGIYALEPFATYTVTFDANGGTGSMADATGVSGEYTLPANGFTAPAGKQFKAWSVGGVEKAVGDKITVTANTTVTAIWEAIEHTVTVSGSYASASGAGEYAVGETVNIYAGTKSGYTFNGWTSDDVTVLSASSKNASFVMPDKDVTVKANWVYTGGGSTGGGYTYYTIKATAGVNGSISPTGNVSVREGRDQTFTITPNKGYAVAKVLIDSKNVGAVKSYTFENVKKNHTIEVVFMKASGNPQTGVFVDVPEGSYYEEAVNWAVEKGITTGTDATHFSPDGICTRAQAVTFLWRAAGSPAAKSAVMPFADVKAGSYYYDAVLWAVENGITKGTSDTMFSPDATCSRAQIVTFLWRSQKSPAAGTANPFTDVKASAYYADAVLWAVKEDVTKGTTNTTFSPDANCTRAQIVTFIWRALAE